MSRRFELSALDDRLRFDVQLQISLRSNAIKIMEHYPDKQKFMKYVGEREEKIRILLNCDENPVILDNGREVFP